jgi:hypothetical protein
VKDAAKKSFNEDTLHSSSHLCNRGKTELFLIKRQLKMCGVSLSTLKPTEEFFQKEGEEPAVWV